MTNPKIRCAVYTRKSTEEGLDQDFNTLQAQREACENYIRSQLHQGWECLAMCYDDGGFSGGNTERPALKRLMADIAAGKIDVVLCYKVDRLSRSLLDFTKLMELFVAHDVSFVSITQQIDTSTSMGRLMLHVLMSFAQFEREIVSERTRDKMAAARRKGKWLGGRPVLGYDVDETTKKLVVNEIEASQVRAIFKLYLELGSLLPVVQELHRRGWCNKRWITRKGNVQGGLAFTKTSLHFLLRNVVYVGKVKYKTELHEGEHNAIIDPTVWQRVQALLRRNGRAGGAAAKNKHGAFLKGLLFCKPCGCAMSPTHTTKRNRLYRYYLCTHAQKTGRGNCPAPSIPAGEIERFVVGHLRGIVQNPSIVQATVAQLQQQAADATKTLVDERRSLNRDLAHWHAELQELASSGNTRRLADLNERIAATERRLAEITAAIPAPLTLTEVTAALARFDEVWAILTPSEQTRFVELLVQRVEYDGSSDKIAITFRSDALPLLADQLRAREEAA